MELEDPFKLLSDTNSFVETSNIPSRKRVRLVTESEAFGNDINNTTIDSINSVKHSENNTTTTDTETDIIHKSKNNGNVKKNENQKITSLNTSELSSSSEDDEKKETLNENETLNNILTFLPNSECKIKAKNFLKEIMKDDNISFTNENCIIIGNENNPGDHIVTTLVHLFCPADTEKMNSDHYNYLKKIARGENTQIIEKNKAKIQSNKFSNNTDTSQKNSGSGTTRKKRKLRTQLISNDEELSLSLS